MEGGKGEGTGEVGRGGGRGWRRTGGTEGGEAEGMEKDGRDRGRGEGRVRVGGEIFKCMLNVLSPSFHHPSVHQLCPPA